MRSLLVLLVLVLGTGVARAQTYEELSSLEKEAADLALAERGLEVDPAPEGKTIGRIHIVPIEVFTEGWLTWANIFHVTTREDVLRRRVLIAPGEPWSADTANETLRTLRDPFFHSVVILFPVKSAEPGKVDVLIVTRDLWSLRLNSAFEVQGGTLTLLRFSLAENNLLGRRKKLSFGFTLDQGKYSLGPTYLDEAIGGSHWQLGAAFRSIFAREDDSVEGSSGSFEVGYPLWNLQRQWAVGATAAYFDGVVRSYEDEDLRTYDNPDTEEVEAVPYRYRTRELSTAVAVTHAMGRSVKHHVSLGHEVSVARPEVEEEQGLDDVTEAAFARDILPRSELISAPYVSYSLFTPVYAHYLNMRTFELREDYRMGPALTLGLSAGSELLGGDADFLRPTASASWTFSLFGDDYYKLGAGTGARREQGGEWIDQSYVVEAYMVSPAFSRFIRVIGSVELAWLRNETQNRFYVAGGNTGLRGYSIGQFAGEARLIGHVEGRSRPFRIGFLRWGGVAFWDFGHAADKVSDLRPKHDVGVGVRILIPQIESEVGRLDWAYALNEPNRGFPGRLSLGFFQVF